MTYKYASYASWPDDRWHIIAKFEGERKDGESTDKAKCLPLGSIGSEYLFL